MGVTGVSLGISSSSFLDSFSPHPLGHLPIKDEEEPDPRPGEEKGTSAGLTLSWSSSKLLSPQLPWSTRPSHLELTPGEAPHPEPAEPAPRAPVPFLSHGSSQSALRFCRLLQTTLLFCYKHIFVIHKSTLFDCQNPVKLCGCSCTVTQPPLCPSST